MANVNVLAFFAVLLILFLSGTVRAESSTIVKKPIKGVVKAAGHAVKKVLPNCVFGANAVQFFAYTRKHPNGVVLHYNSTIKRIRKVLRPGHLCVGGAHGFLSQANTTQLLKVYQRWLEVENVNIVAVNWDEGACNDEIPITDWVGYKQAVKNTRDVGRRYAKFFMKLSQAGVCAIEDIRVFGHSLGAHVAGFAGKTIFELTKKKIRMIIGLDTAGPGFENNDCADRLCKSDAQYVEAVHTSDNLGIKMSVGHVDFAVNIKRSHQPGCITSSCDHTRSLELFRDSLLPTCSLIGTRLFGDSICNCTPDTCNKIGLNAPQYPTTGRLYVQVKQTKEPFCNYFKSS